MQNRTAIVTRDNLILSAGEVIADYRSWGSVAGAMAASTVADLRRAGVEVVDLRTPEQRRAAFAVVEREAAEHRASRLVEMGLSGEAMTVA
jgi:hypothetical protein